jgi:selenide,water dikinase
VLSDLPVSSDARVLIDYRTADDAGVYALGGDLALVQTVDFFTPIVDDPFTFGEIAAANALSDVYAMGGEPLTALAVAAFPAREFDPADIRAIFAGGQSKLREAGVALLGGHTVQDAEVKFGYAVTGTIHPTRVWANARARVGDALLLTKALGTGIITTALKYARAPQDAVDAAVESMRKLNRSAADALRSLPAGTVSACTDITGFGLIGHAQEMALASHVTLALDVDRVPLLTCAVDLALENRPGGGMNNQKHFGPRVRGRAALDPRLESALYDPQTSGGLLVCVAGGQVEPARAALRARSVEAQRVGDVLPHAEFPIVLR